MIYAFLLFQLATTSNTPRMEVDRICRARCEILTVQEGTVRFINEWPPSRTLSLGRYAAEAQSFVPRTEAPVRDLRSEHGWRVVVSSYLDHDQDELLTHLRFFGPAGRLREETSVLAKIERAQIGNLFGGADEIFAVTSNEEHAYNARTEIWWLPQDANPTLLIEVQGQPRRFLSTSSGGGPGVSFDRQTYDGVNADTKRTVEEFYVWDSTKKSLTPR